MPSNTPKTPKRAAIKAFPLPMKEADFSDAQIDQVLALDTTLTVHQLNLLLSAEQNPRLHLPLWGEPHLNRHLKAVENPVYDLPVLLTAAGLQEVVQLKALGLLRLVELAGGECWQLTERGRQVGVLNRHRLAQPLKAPPMTPSAA